MKKYKKIILWSAAVAVALGLGAAMIFGFTLNSRNEEIKGSEFAAVYMATGDIYFGKMDWLPWPKLENVWYIQRGVDQKQQPQTGLAPLKGVFWSPIDEIYLNPKEIVFWTKVKAGSQLAQALENPEALRQQTQFPPNARPSGEFKGPTTQPPAK